MMINPKICGTKTKSNRADLNKTLDIDSCNIKTSGQNCENNLEQIIFYQTQENNRRLLVSSLNRVHARNVRAWKNLNANSYNHR